MTGSSGVVISNLAYLVGAVVLAVILGLVVWLRHRPPRSVESNMESFHRGLRALAPDGRAVYSSSTGAPRRPTGLRIQPQHEADGTEETEPVDQPEEEAQPVAVAADEDAEVEETTGELEVIAVADAEPDEDAAAPVVDLSEQAHHQPAAGEAAGDWAGAETG